MAEIPGCYVLYVQNGWCLKSKIYIIGILFRIFLSAYWTERRLGRMSRVWVYSQAGHIFLLFGEFVFAGHDVYIRCLFAYAKLKSPHVSHRHLCSGETNPTFVSRGVTPGPGCAFDFVRHNNLSASVRGLETQYYTFARTCGPSARNNSIADARFNTPLSYL